MKATLSIVFIFLVISVSGQSFLDMKDKNGLSLYEDNWFNWMLRYTYVSGKANEKLGGFTGNVSIRSAKVGKGEISVNYENLLLGDFIWKVAHLKKSEYFDQGFSSGLLGWVQGYYNVVSTDKFIFAAGGSLGDYIFGSEIPTEIAPNVFSNEPFGYYLTVGPSFKVSYLINKDFWVDGVLTCDIPFAKFNSGTGANYQHEDGYPNPWFVNVTGTLFHKSRLFLSVRANQGIDRGANGGGASRLDVSLGYQMLH